MTEKRILNAGGQAVIEGVMMRTPDYFVIAVRKPDGTIKVRSRRWENLFPGIVKKPFLRGMFVLYEAMYNGMQAITWSANESVEEGKEEDKLTKTGTVMTILAAFALAMLLFVALPHGAAYFLEKGIRGETSINSMLFHFIDGVVKVIIFSLYLWGISKMAEVRRLFSYHGAEHKAITTWEAGEELIPENARKYPTAHPRCGTSFMITVILISIIVFTVVFAFVPPITGSKLLDNLAYIFIKILLIFPIGGVSYELQKLVSRFPKSRVLAVMIAPGLWYQRITTTEPAPDVLEIGLVSLTTALDLQEKKAVLPLDGAEEIFHDFAEFRAKMSGALNPAPPEGTPCSI
ncbi:MAG TPA: DUF1385 domain-containing protein [bacterium]|nr:DUF1385 domain-containing protein [bacterium]